MSNRTFLPTIVAAFVLGCASTSTVRNPPAPSTMAPSKERCEALLQQKADGLYFTRTADICDLAVCSDKPTSSMCSDYMKEQRVKANARAVAQAMFDNGMEPDEPSKGTCGKIDLQTCEKSDELCKLCREAIIFKGTMDFIRDKANPGESAPTHPDLTQPKPKD